MEKMTFSIPNISCGHCVMAIKNELIELDGIKYGGGQPGGQEHRRRMGSTDHRGQNQGDAERN